MLRRPLLLTIGGILAIIGGAAMVFSGFQTHSFFLSILKFLQMEAQTHLPPVALSILALVVQILALLISLGGITVIAGGLAALTHHVSMGRLLIALGGGAGFFALAVGIVYYLAVSGLPSIMLHAEYWAGVVLAVLARWLLKKA